MQKGTCVGRGKLNRCLVKYKLTPNLSTRTEIVLYYLSELIKFEACVDKFLFYAIDLIRMQYDAVF